MPALFTEICQVGSPTLRQLFDGADVDITVMKVFFQL
jgi:hypothetical protein